jgi:type II secretory pathway pseudopilin PulG
VAARLHSRRPGLTLLELILALSLSVVLLSAVGMALRLYWRSFDVKRTNVEQAHLARALLRRMEDDIRSAVQHTPVDLSGLESMTASTANLASALGGTTGGPSSAAAGGGSTGGAGATGGSATSQTPTSQSGAGTSGGSAPSGSSKTGATTSGGAATTGGAATSGQPAGGETEETETTEQAPPAVVGLYGSEYQLKFDVSRLPRVDEYAGGSPTSMVQIPSDIKTVTYYVRSESATGGDTALGGAAPAGSMEPSTSGQGRGLIRMEMDRAVSTYDESSGTASIGADQARLLAQEVTSIQFRYWNGTEWATEWDSDEMGGLPLAIEVVMAMADPNAVVPTGPPAQNFGAAETASTDTSYRIVVHLPTASLPPPTEEPATEGDAAATGTSPASATGSSGASGGATSGGTTTGASSGTGNANPGATK